MKRVRLIRHLKKNNCDLIREGGRHSVWKNLETGDIATVPRHNEIKNFLAQKICKDLRIKKPKTN